MTVNALDVPPLPDGRPALIEVLPDGEDALGVEDDGKQPQTSIVRVLSMFVWVTTSGGAAAAAGTNVAAATSEAARIRTACSFHERVIRQEAMTI